MALGCSEKWTRVSALLWTGAGKEISQENRIRIGTWNIGFVTGKLMEIVDTMTRSRINIVCLQKTKWVGEKSRKIEHVEYILWYTGRDKKYK